ncbi:hypothetical protein [Loktanella sp. R86503]|uniref:hypothetical protein n=1 Tax=Loktanella sp. R86503 TaxID=3093847 RepID=UPI0036D836CF
MTPHTHPAPDCGFRADASPAAVTGAVLTDPTPRAAPFLSPAELWLQRANAAHTAAVAAFSRNPSHRNRQRLSDACLERVKAYNRLQEVSE